MKARKSAEESAGQLLKVKLPFDRKLSKEILIKCSKNDIGDTSEQNTIITEDGETASRTQCREDVKRKIKLL